MKVPSLHFSHVVSVVFDPSALNIVPALQSVQALQLAEFALLDQYLFGQSEHTRSVLSVLRVDTYRPATQVVISTQSVRLPVDEYLLTPQGGVGAGVGAFVGDLDGALLWS